MIILPSILDVRLIGLIESGGVGVIPTDTIYGLAASATSKTAVQRLYALKQREHKPGTLIAANPAQLVALGLDERTVRTVSHLWPSPLSVVIPSHPRLGYLDQGLGDVAVRIPAQDNLLKLLEQTGPLLTTSANHPQKPPANTVTEAQDYFGNSVDFYVDGGDLSGQAPSTVARIGANGRLEILRQGAAVIDARGELAGQGTDKPE